MPVWSSGSQPSPLSNRLDLSRRWAIVGLFLLQVGYAGLVSADQFTVSNVSLRVEADTYLLDSDIDLQLSEEVTEALENGVTITVVFETDVVRTRLWTWDEKVADIEARHSIEFYALSGIYVLRHIELGISRSYTRLYVLLEDLGRVRGFPLIARPRVDPGEAYLVRVRARLDIESLPSPLRPLAYLSSLWRLQSDWVEHPLQP
jgi:hypothetical protein